MVLAMILNVAMRSQLSESALGALHGKVVRIVVRDAGLRLTVGCDAGWFRGRVAREAADVTFSATVRDFAALALREEDADTLFFARRLAIEGDTELGLVLKNALDAMDMSRLTHFLELLRPRRGA